MATTAKNMINEPANLKADSDTAKFLKKKGGRFVGSTLADIKKQDHIPILQALGRLDTLENEQFTTWYKAAFAQGFNAPAQANFLCDGLRYFGIFESLAYDKWGATANYCCPDDSILWKLTTETYTALKDVTTNPPSSNEIFGQKWTRNAQYSNENVGVVVYTSNEEDKQLLGILQTHTNKMEEWKAADPRIAQFEQNGWVLRAPTLICLTPPGGSKIKDAPNAKVTAAALNLGVGWNEDTEFRLTASTLNDLLARVGDAIMNED